MDTDSLKMLWRVWEWPKQAHTDVHTRSLKSSARPANASHRLPRAEALSEQIDQNACFTKAFWVFYSLSLKRPHTCEGDPTGGRGLMWSFPERESELAYGSLTGMLHISF